MRAEFPFVNALNSHACQVAVERAYSAIARFYSNCKKDVPGKKGYPKFKKNCRSVEYKTSGWKLSRSRKQIDFIDKKGIGKLKLKGTWDLNFYQLDQIKRVRLVRRADGYYVQFLVSAENKVDAELTGKMMGASRFCKFVVRAGKPALEIREQDAPTTRIFAKLGCTQDDWLRCGTS